MCGSWSLIFDWQWHWDVLAMRASFPCPKPLDPCFPESSPWWMSRQATLGIVYELMHTWILICGPSLPLAAEELLEWILIISSAEKYLHIWDLENNTPPTP